MPPGLIARARPRKIPEPWTDACRPYAIRLAVDGDGQVKRELVSVGQSGEQSLKRDDVELHFCNRLNTRRHVQCGR